MRDSVIARLPSPAELPINRTPTTGFGVFRSGKQDASMNLLAKKTLDIRARFRRQMGRTKKGVIVSSNHERKKASTKLPGTVEKVIKPHPHSNEPEKAQITVEGADHLYRELRVPNRLTDDDGHLIKLKEGTEVEVKIESENDAGAESGDHSSS